VVEPGRRCLGDRYELDRLIAAGGMGQVWRATDIALHRPVAVKVLRSEYTGDPTFVARFRAEAQHAASLSHPNTAAVFDYGEATAQDGTGETLAYLVMELVEGEPLSSLLAREGSLDTGTTLSILRQAAFALADAHRAGLVHRDVKPGNILVRPDGCVKITDFGIAWSARNVALTRTGQVIGTPQYLSPEAAEGHLATPASDVYALGLIGYECLTGHPAFEGDNAVTIALKQVQQEPEPLPGSLPADVRGLIGRALDKDPAARFPDGAAFVEAVEDVIDGRPLSAGPGTVAVPVPADPPEPVVAVPPGPDTAAVLQAPAPRRRGPLAMALLGLLGLLAGAGIAAAVIAALSTDRPASTATAAELQERGEIVLDAEDYVGRPLAEVTDRLAALGLTVEPRAEEHDDVVPDSVTGVDPAGEPLAAGETVVVTYAVAPTGGSRPEGGTGAVTGAAGGRAPEGPAPSEAAVADPTTAPGDDAPAADPPPSAPASGSSSADPTGTPPSSPSSPSSSAPSTPTTSAPAPSTSPPATDGEGAGTTP
jgi:eukaryotic-like serine/threonine-protein kinase